VSSGGYGEVIRVIELAREAVIADMAAKLKLKLELCGVG